MTTGDEAETATTDGESVNRNPSMVSSSFANSLSPIERLIQRYSQIVIDPVRLKLMPKAKISNSSKFPNDGITNANEETSNALHLGNLELPFPSQPEPGEYCPICHLQLSAASPCGEDDDDRALVCLTLCHHKLHLSCVKSLVENQSGGPNYIECPKCNTVRSRHVQG